MQYRVDTLSGYIIVDKRNLDLVESTLNDKDALIYFTSHVGVKHIIPSHAILGLSTRPEEGDEPV